MQKKIGKKSCTMIQATSFDFQTFRLMTERKNPNTTRTNFGLLSLPSLTGLINNERHRQRNKKLQYDSSRKELLQSLEYNIGAANRQNLVEELTATCVNLYDTLQNQRKPPRLRISINLYNGTNKIVERILKNAPGFSNSKQSYKKRGSK